ncbi:hypothetical protein AX14_006638 [Amanita brunnescens Koide BX004]|nr:hypothetical protein AX14_006638 [Amanita brunnescens Koide BX004]
MSGPPPRGSFLRRLLILCRGLISRWSHSKPCISPARIAGSGNGLPDSLADDAADFTSMPSTLKAELHALYVTLYLLCSSTTYNEYIAEFKSAHYHHDY